MFFIYGGFIFILKASYSKLYYLKQIGGDSNYPAEFDVWMEKSFLFKVETKGSSNSQFETSFRVRRICDDASILTLFQVDGSALTPKEVVCKFFIQILITSFVQL